MDMANKKEHQDTIRKINATPGFRCRVQRSGHYQAVNETTGKKLTISGSPTDYHAYRNMLRQLESVLGWTADLPHRIRQADRARRIERHNSRFMTGAGGSEPPPQS